MAEETKKPKTQTVKEVSIIVSLNGKPVAQCAGLDVALITLEGIVKKIENTENFIISIGKTTTDNEEQISE